MKAEPAACFTAAVIVHALLLFGFRMGTPAQPLAVSNAPPSVEASLVDAPPAPPASTPEPPEPQPTPDMSTPAPPEPTPDMSTPEPTPDVSTPQPTPVPEAMSESTPRHMTRPRHSRSSAPHSAPGMAASLAGAASRGPAAGRSSRASYLSNPRPEYPEEARMARQEGVVLVSVEVEADGRPGDVSLERGSGFPLLDSSALRAVRRWMFAPAQAGGVPVASRVVVPVRFSLEQ